MYNNGRLSKEVNTMEKTIYINNQEEMSWLAKTITKSIFDGFVICLSGDLGAGKTTFTQYLGRHLGINDAINSPTFTIMKTYEHTPKLTHIDAYRLEEQGDDADIEEFIGNEGVTVIEWYTFIPLALPKDYLALDIEWLGETKRKIKVKGTGRYEKTVEILNH